MKLGTSIGGPLAGIPRAAQRAEELGYDFVLGLGSQVKGHNERRFSVGWSAPAPRMKEYVKTLRAIWESFQTATYDKLPEFVREHREYASRITFMMPASTARDRERFEHVRSEVQAVQTPGVPRGLA